MWEAGSVSPMEQTILKYQQPPPMIKKLLENTFASMEPPNLNPLLPRLGIQS